ncbi:hypothetical protein PHLCEN_2v767 [Hermanssonia centrifuga]|uniref:Uncharacterized protein n=1 Tax=Hermanssonia centrifuga TaxID=98765 RepID=A0A2R6S574_9APHY|nr:hypothetical protein PHLCEN_2v767 [Hermanssonia centrifuga]
MYPTEEDFGLDHPISTILPDYPALYDDYEYDDYILLPLTLPGVLIPSPGLPEEPYGLYSEVRRHHAYLWPSYPDVAQDLLSPPPHYDFDVSEFDDDDDEPLLSTQAIPNWFGVQSKGILAFIFGCISLTVVAGFQSRGITRHFDVWLKKLKDTFRKLVRST